MTSRLVWLVCVVALLCAHSVVADPAADGCSLGTIPEYGNCTGGHTGCCVTGMICYNQDDEYAQCRKKGTCPCSAWDCTELEPPCWNPVALNGNCRYSGCCADGLVCYEQDSEYAQCRPPGACPSCSSSWTCNVVHNTAATHSSASKLGFSGEIVQEEARLVKSEGGSDSWKKIVGGVSAGVSGVVLFVVLVVYATRKRQPLPINSTELKSDLAYAMEADLRSDPYTSVQPSSAKMGVKAEIMSAIDPNGDLKLRRRSSAGQPYRETASNQIHFE